MFGLNVSQFSLPFLATLGLVVAVAATVQAAKLHVANNGVDSATCGDKSTPCRSISQAIQNASNGDKIIVGPGQYGDLDGDGTFGETGEEDAEVGGGCFCMIKVDKPLAIESRDGAFATVLDAGGVNISVVSISTGGVVLGKKKKGFTLTHGGNTSSGLLITAGTNGVRVTGNVATANSGYGFLFGGSGHLLTGNVATANEIGFAFSGSGHRFSGNVASANGVGGFVFDGNGHLLTGNVATANDNGFIFIGSGHLLSGNSALGNKRFGIFIENFGGVESATITKNNLFGNNSQPIAIGVNTFTNCGLLNRSGDSFTAPNNFWGTTTGPGTFGSPQPEPADNVCDDLSVSGSSTTVPSFVTKEFKVKVNVLDEFPADAVPVLAPRSTIEFPGESQLSVYSLTGQLLAIVSNQTQLALTTRHLPNGIYLTVKTYADGRRELVKLMVKW